jgi:ribosomal protein S27E
MVEWFLPRATVATLARAKGETLEEEFSFLMTVACPLCTNLNEVLAQPSSISWKQVACSSCEANLVLVRESSSNTPRRSLTSAIRLIAPSPGTRQRTAITRTHLVIVVATALALGVLGYLFLEGYLSFSSINGQ